MVTEPGLAAGDQRDRQRVDPTDSGYSPGAIAMVVPGLAASSASRMVGNAPAWSAET